MAKLTELLHKRFFKKEDSLQEEKQPMTWSLSVSPSSEEKELFFNLLQKYADDQQDVEADAFFLLSISTEVRAISNQAAILHGERIKKAQEVLKKYRDGAFTAWLLATYGNRQTPYNFLQYYDFYKKISPQLHANLDKMPRQAVYTLASREGSLAEKEEFVKEYQGASKQDLISRIRKKFPLDKSDKRRENEADKMIQTLHKLKLELQKQITLKTEQKEKALQELEALTLMMKQYPTEETI